MSLADSMARHLLQARSVGTVSKYYGAFRRWEAFIQAEGASSISAEPIHVALYLTHLMDSSCSPGVVQSALYVIKWAHTIRGFADPTDNHYVINLLEAAKRTRTVPVVKKDIVSSEQIIWLCEKYSSSQDILILRDLCIILLCFAGFLRFNEVSALKCKDIQFHGSYASIKVK